MSSAIEITPDDFGPSRYGVHLYSHEDDWGWTAYGHHERRRILAAVFNETREIGVYTELQEATECELSAFTLRERWAYPTKFGEGWFPNFCEADHPGAMPVTVVHL